MKHAKDYLAEANAAVPRISAEDGIAIHEQGSAVFIDVRDSSDIANTGTIAGALRIPRGFIEFAADDTTDFHNPALTKDSQEKTTSSSMSLDCNRCLRLSRWRSWCTMPG